MCGGVKPVGERTALPLCCFFIVIEVKFTEQDCDQYRHYLSSENDVYNVVWYGEMYPWFCTLKFKLSTGLYTYRICAKVTRINLECGKDLAVVYSYGSTVYKVCL